MDGLLDQGVAFLQASLIRLGFDPGAIDGIMGLRTQGALQDAGADANSPADSVSQLLRQRSPASSETSVPLDREGTTWNKLRIRFVDPRDLGVFS
ncbi:MAG TPA: hypothetical protein VG204_15665 [Terriglobia bacterium]|nr:hypothetical protein [Terriglobia bacterium]